MKIQLSNIQYIITEDNSFMFPNMHNVEETDRLFIVCNDDESARIIITGINNKLSNSSKSITLSDFNEILDEAEPYFKKQEAFNLALALFQSNGCLVAQMGSSRVLQINTADQEIKYDSRDQVLDLYSDKAKVFNITDIAQGDVLIITLVGRVNINEVVNNVCSGEDIASKLSNSLSLNDRKAPAAFVIPITNVEGKLNMTIPDISFKWIAIIMLLVVIVVSAVLFSMSNGNSEQSIINNTTSEDTVQQIINRDSVADTVITPIPESTTQPPVIEENKTQIDTIKQEAKQSESNSNNETANKQETIDEQPQPEAPQNNEVPINTQ
ncbi:MAG: hypothetical protein KBT10_06905 [Bacteroidales bacterium]|nr:hypothetical protein [Candidatus Sodaliphilus aphodohippi]